MEGWKMGALQGRRRRLEASGAKTAEWQNMSFGQKRNKDGYPGGVVTVVTVVTVWLVLCQV